jgi:hypothetical protein
MMTPTSFDTFSFLEPWTHVRQYASNLEKELHKETTQGHPLYARKVSAIARRNDSDDVLFEVDSPDFRFAVVHLTCTGESEHDPRWPGTELFATFEDWIKNRMDPDHKKLSEQ